MSIKLIYNGVVDANGKLKIQNKNVFIGDLKYFAGKDIELIIKNRDKNRSNSQNKYFHGVAIPIIKNRLIELGFYEAYSNEWVKDFIKVSCLKIEVINKQSGEIFESLGKTSNLNTKEFNDLIERLTIWCAEKLDLILPLPNEIIKINFE
jgi:hypothetical protein